MAGRDISSMDPEIIMGAVTDVETGEVTRRQFVRVPLTDIFELPQEVKEITEQ